MFDYINPISYNTDINSLVFNYNTGRTQGMKPSLFDYNNPLSCSFFNNINIYKLGNININFNSNNYIQNPYGYNNNNSSLFNFRGSVFAGQNNFNGGRQNPFAFFSPGFNIYKIGISNTPAANYPSHTSIEPENKPISNTTKSTNNEQIGNNLAQNARKYLGYNEADGSYKKFSNSTEWCADFVSYVVDETYKNKGLIPPAGFANHRVENLKNWGIKNNKYFSIAEKNNKEKLIAENVKTGDILILRENNASHTGIVSKVNKDGTFETIEGNRTDKVGIGKYSPDNSQISGFVQLA